ncbi:MAG: methyl coenzyme M reductase-arginine methyltransferase Mmp10 [Methanomicrobiales archaeon]|nr:methyl coenzyme M reductase-arginine methyltransferase Mmp10 [Methanomicrobiales archaeon]
MAQLVADIGGRPGIDCRGFCEYCYFRHAREVPAFGCRYCPPFRKGCDYCSRSVGERYTGFRTLSDIGEDILARLQVLQGELSRVTISGGGDPSCYPRFTDLVELLASMEAPLHIGYTSGKGFADPKIASFLIGHGLTELSFTVFAADPLLRKKYMHDPHPKVSLRILEDLCGSIDVYAAAVILPGVNDGAVLEKTCAWLEERGAKGLIVMRFANTVEQGLILGNAPLFPNAPVHSVEEFRDLVSDLASRYSLRITGTPLWDPAIGSPFAILQELDLLDRLPRIAGDTRVLTGTVAAPFLRRIIALCGGSEDQVITAGKEIACLITADDLSAIDPVVFTPGVVIPGRAFVHEGEAAEIISRDGVERRVIRGPDVLTADGETSMGMTRNQVLELEMEGLAELIRAINRGAA